MGAEMGAETKSEPNVVPLCDILLVLLIIFMVITPAVQKGIDIKLPETASEDEIGGAATTSIVLTIEKDLSIKLNTELVDKTMLESRLRDLYQTRQDKVIFIRADESISFRDVLEVIDIAKGAGIETLGVIPERHASN